MSKQWSWVTEIEIPFHDVDMMRIAWHGHYAKYFELARCELLDSIDYNYQQMKASGYGWPVIDMHIRYVKPCQFGQVILVQAKIVEWENRLRIAYVIKDKQSGERLTKGHTDQVAVSLADNTMQFVSPVILFEKLGLEAL